MEDRDRIARQRANPLIARLWKAMRPLRSVASVLNTGAHPDDEKTAMLAALAIRDGMRVAVACANRGEGGQNNLGTERGADLGAVRTREMERAADEIGMGLYWLSETPEDPITDFGFSKSGEETFGRWGREATVERLVRIIREERPDIVVPTFLDVPGQHGHHRAMTQAAHEAVARAADAEAFPEQIAGGLAPWQVAKLYLPAFSGGGRSYDDTEPPPNATVVVDSSGRDPVLGASYSQIGEWSRAMHISQGMGDWIDPHGEAWPLHRAFAIPGMPECEARIGEGLPETLADLAPLADNHAMGRLLEAAGGAIGATLAVWPDMQAIARTAAIALNAVASARALLSDGEKALFDHRLARKEEELSEVVSLAAGLNIRLVPETGTVSPGETVFVSSVVTPHFGAIDGMPLVEMEVPAGWQATPDEGGFEIAVPEDAPSSDPYPPRYEPSGRRDPVRGRAKFSVNGTEVSAIVRLESPITVLPAATVRIEPAAVVVNTAGKAKDPSVAIAVEDNAGGRSGRTVSLGKGGGWTTSFGKRGEANAVIEGSGVAQATLTRKAAAKAGLAELPVVIDGKPASTLTRSRYAHTGEVFRAAPAVLRVLTLKAELPAKLRIAYAGSGNDAVDVSLRAMGGSVETLGPQRLSQSDLAQYDTIVIGIFALGGRPDLAARIDEIHDWVRAGGNLVTLYHRPWDNWDAERTPLARLEIGQPSLRWRVTDEAAKVKVLAPKHPLLSAPNKIAAADWSGWKKERGLYFAKSWDDAYEPLLEMADPDEEPHRGALLTGAFGKGRHTHVSLILHHQMERLVPGGFRLMANLVSGGKA